MYEIATTVHKRLDLGDVAVFYRETIPDDPAAPVLLLLHGFPSASHQYRRLMDVLGRDIRMIAPDYPGFGHSDMPTPASTGGGFTYSFDHLAEVMERFVERLGLDRFALYLFDFGAPIGLRLAHRLDGRITGLVVQNGNAYEAGLSALARDFIALSPDQPGASETVDGLLTLEMTRGQYEGGAADPGRIAPDGWTLDQHFLDLPGRKQPQRDLAFDYKSNLARYGEWQEWLRRRQPPLLVLWGSNDPFFIADGARAYLADVPGARLHLFETGHFALEECLPAMAPLIGQFIGGLKD